jgi:hypothetical protein
MIEGKYDKYVTFDRFWESYLGRKCLYHEHFPTHRLALETWDDEHSPN